MERPHNDQPNLIAYVEQTHGVEVEFQPGCTEDDPIQLWGLGHECDRCEMWRAFYLEMIVDLGVLETQ